MNIEFIEFLVKNQVIRFGEFTLKSGRKSPYFINMGAVCNGKSSSELGKFFAKRMNEAFPKGLDIIFGPAYKGIPLAVSASIAMGKVGWVFDRKEEKTHGDKGAFVGSQITKDSRIVIIDDVMTTGGTKEEAIEKVKSIFGAEIKAVFIAVDREEVVTRCDDPVGASVSPSEKPRCDTRHIVSGESKLATEEFTEKTGIPVYSIEKISNIFEYLRKNKVEGKLVVDEKIYKAFLGYRELYGVK